MSALRPAGSTRRWRRLRSYVLARDGWRCQLWVDAGGRHVEDGDPAAARRCHAYAYHVDHRVERAAGGGDDLDNLRAACMIGNLGRPRPNGRARHGPPGGRRQTRQSDSWAW